MRVRDVTNESFHEHRPSFRSLVAKFDSQKNSMSYEFKKPSIDQLIKQKSIRQQFSASFSSTISDMKSLALSAASLNASFASLGLISEGEEEEALLFHADEELEDEIDEKAEQEMAEILAELDLMADEEEVLQSSPPPDLFVKSMEKAPPSQDKPVEHPNNNKKKKRTPKFVTDPFANNYELGDELGSGAFAVVRDGKHLRTGKIYAIKIVEIESMDKADLEGLQIEINVMARLKHPNIIRLYEAYCEKEYYYLVTEKMMGGELLDRIVLKTFYNEKEARDTCLILFEAMKYCHSKKIAHRDLKPENLLLQSNENDSDIKIADFGFAKRCPSTGLTTMCGSPSYVAPEILEREPYNTQCDLWSLGVIVYILLGGYSPFDERDQNVLFQRIREGDYEFHPEHWSPVSHDAKDFIKRLLNVNPRKRMTAIQALNHKWMTTSGDLLADKDLGNSLFELKRFNAKRKFKAAVKTIIATQKLSSLFS